MKKLIAAAVAASLTSVAFADISITGSAKANYKAKETDANATTNTVSTEHDIAITGKAGNTTVVTKIAGDDAASGFTIEDNYLTTSVGDVSVKVGDWDNGNNYLRESSRTNNALELGTSVGPVGVTYWSGHGDADDKITLKTDLQGVGVKYVTQAKDEELVLSANVSGIGITYHADMNDTANTDKTSVEITGKVGDMGVKYVNVDTDSLAYFGGDMFYGDWEQTYGTGASAQGTATGLWYAQKGMDIQAIELSTAMAGNAVKFRHIAVDADDATTDANDRTINRLIVTRPLTSGATMEVMYTDAQETSDSAESYSELDVELSVKF
jgi:hypothetical protein